MCFSFPFDAKTDRSTWTQIVFLPRLQSIFLPFNDYKHKITINLYIQPVTLQIVFNAVLGSGTLVLLCISDENVASHLSFPIISQVL